MTLNDYVNEVEKCFEDLCIRHSDKGIALNLLSFAVNMRNTDMQGKNIGASITITDETSNENN